MLSSVLRSERAVQVNIAIMRAFVSLRGLLTRTVTSPGAFCTWKRSMIGSSRLYLRPSGK